MFVVPNKWRRTYAFVAVCTAAFIAGCAQTPTPAPTAAPDIAPTPPTSVATPSAPAPTPAAPVPSSPPAPTTGSAASAAAPSAIARSARHIATTEALTPSGVNRYQCLSSNNTGGTSAPIVLPENTLRVCSRFPAMGPCQYERDACRAKRGRVIRFDGVEITKEVEAEYDKQVQRFRLNAG